MRTWLLGGCIAAATCGGVFFAFSTFVTLSLHRLGAAPAADAMRSMIVYAVNPSFMALLFGTGLLGLGLSFGAWRGAGGGWAVHAATLIYVAGCIGVTVAANVPLNDRLAATTGGGGWDAFYGPWMAWNHVRMAACLAASALWGWAALAAAA